MNKNNFLLSIILLLAICNVALLFFLLKKPKERLDHDRPKNIIIEKLHFDQNQIVDYQKMIDQHRIDVKKNDSKILELKNELYQLLLEDKPSAKSDSIALEIGKIQQEIETIHFRHFQDIKKLCKPEQVGDFQALAKDLTKIFNHKKVMENQKR